MNSRQVSIHILYQRGRTRRISAKFGVGDFNLKFVEKLRLWLKPDKKKISVTLHEAQECFIWFTATYYFNPHRIHFCIAIVTMAKRSHNNVQLDIT